jgi:hypothetical protein
MMNSDPTLYPTAETNNNEKVAVGVSSTLPFLPMESSTATAMPVLRSAEIKSASSTLNPLNLLQQHTIIRARLPQSSGSVAYCLECARKAPTSITSRGLQYTLLRKVEQTPTADGNSIKGTPTANNSNNSESQSSKRRASLSQRIGLKKNNSNNNNNNDNKTNDKSGKKAIKKRASIAQLICHPVYRPRTFADLYETTCPDTDEYETYRKMYHCGLCSIAGSSRSALLEHVKLHTPVDLLKFKLQKAFVPYRLINAKISSAVQTELMSPTPTSERSINPERSVNFRKKIAQSNMCKAENGPTLFDGRIFDSSGKLKCEKGKKNDEGAFATRSIPKYRYDAAKDGRSSSGGGSSSGSGSVNAGFKNVNFKQSGSLSSMLNSGSSSDNSGGSITISPVLSSSPLSTAVVYIDSSPSLQANEARIKSSRSRIKLLPEIPA